MDKDEALDYLIKNHFDEMKDVVFESVSDNDMFSYLFSCKADEVHALAIEKGWWDEERNDGELIALIHSELSECLEALRHGNPPDDKLPAYLASEVELADVVIRVMDMASARGWRVAEAIIDKHEYNKTRDRKHGKKF